MSLYNLWVYQCALSLAVAVGAVVVGAVGASSAWAPSATVVSVAVWLVGAFLLYPRGGAPGRPTDAHAP